MTWNSRYVPPDQIPWQGRPDLPPESCFFQVIRLLDLSQKIQLPELRHALNFGLIGFCCDEGIRRNHGRIGATEGPNAIRLALAKLAVHKHHFTLFDAGNITCLDHDLEASQNALSDAVQLLLSHNITPIVLGGGHEVAWGHFQGIAKTYINKNLGIINFDAHLDMRPMLANHQGTSGSPFLQIAEAYPSFDYNCVGLQPSANTDALIATANKYDTKILWANELHLGHSGLTVDFIDRMIDYNEMIYLSLCLDVFASAFAPGVSATQALGLYPWHVIPMIRALAASGKVISYDIAELSPPHDPDQRTAKLAATLIYEFIHHHNEEPRDW